MSEMSDREIPHASAWRVLVDIATVVWLGIFAASFVPDLPLDTSAADKVGLGLLGVFVADLGVTYYRAAEKPLPFVRNHWLDVLLVIPYFRIFRILRVVRFLRLLRLVQQPRPGALLRIGKSALNGLRASRKGKRTMTEASASTSSFRSRHRGRGGDNPL